MMDPIKHKDVPIQRSTTLYSSHSTAQQQCLQQFQAALNKMVELNHRLEHTKLKLGAAQNTVQFHLDRMEHMELMAQWTGP